MNEPSKHLSTPMGIHRLLKEPYDDREVFTSIDDLKEYCRNGACYNGQRVACIIGSANKGGYIQDFIIYNKMAIAKFNNSEIITCNEIPYASDSNSYMLIYEDNHTYTTSPLIHNSSTKSHLNYLNSAPSGYSIMELIKLFEYYDNNVEQPAKFILVIQNTSYPYNKTYIKFNFNYLENMDACLHDSSRTYSIKAPATSLSSLDGSIKELSVAHAIDDNSLMKIIVTKNDNSTITVHLFPKNTGINTYSFWLYVYSPDYIRAAEVI